MPGFTNRGLKLLDYMNVRKAWLDRNGAVVAMPTNWYAVLVMASGTQPTADTNLLAELTQPSGNGYPNGGIAVPVSSAGFPSVTEDDALDRSVVAITDQTFSAVGGNIGPVSKVALVDDAAVIADRQVICWFDLPTNHTINDGTDTLFSNLRLESASP